MNSLVKHIPGFMKKDDSMFVYDYVINTTNDFMDFGNTEKEFTFNANFKNENVKDLLDNYGKKVWNFVSQNYDGPFEDYDNSKTHLAKFSEGYGMHEHFDTTKPNDIATLIYINSDYEGGEIYFPDLGIEIKPSIGDLVCFPDTPDFVHGVKPIIKGTRYTSPCWITRIV